MQVILNKRAVLREFQSEMTLLRSPKQQAAAEPGRIAAEANNGSQVNWSRRVSETTPVGFNRGVCGMSRSNVITSMPLSVPLFGEEASVSDWPRPRLGGVDRPRKGNAP